MNSISHFIRIIMVVVMVSMVSSLSYAQSILGTWQLVKETSCMENGLKPEPDSVSSLIMEMKEISSATPQIIKFKEKGVGEENTRILNRRKSANSRNFLYKMNGEILLILDKKSQTISESYAVDKISRDSLVISNSSRPCDIKFLVKIKEPK